MSVPALLFRFVGLHMCMWFLGAGAVTFLGIEGGMPLDTAVLIGSVMTACLWFSYTNKRYFTASEKRTVVTGMLVIDMGIQALIASVALAGQELHPASLLFATVFLAALHLFVIWSIVSFTGKRLAKQMIRDA